MYMIKDGEPWSCSDVYLGFVSVPAQLSASTDQTYQIQWNKVEMGTLQVAALASITDWSGAS